MFTILVLEIKGSIKSEGCATILRCFTTVRRGRAEMKRVYTSGPIRSIAAVLLFTTPFTYGANAPFDYTVPGQFFLIKQPTNMVCWATAATMLRSWKQQQKRDIGSVMDEAGFQFRVMFDHNEGLSSEAKQQFLDAMKLKTEPPATYTGPAILNLLKQYGPVWVTTTPPGGKSFSIHARIVIGITGSDQDALLTVADPADGAKHVESITAFTAEMEAIAKNDYGNGADVRPLIVHY